MIDAGQARKEDLFRHGTVGKVIGIQRRAYSEPALVVQGVQRFTIRRVLKERPFFEAEAVVHDEKGQFSFIALPCCCYFLFGRLPKPVISRNSLRRC